MPVSRPRNVWGSNVKWLLTLGIRRCDTIVLLILKEPVLGASSLRARKTDKDGGCVNLDFYQGLHSFGRSMLCCMIGCRELSAEGHEAEPILSYAIAIFATLLPENTRTESRLERYILKLIHG